MAGFIVETQPTAEPVSVTDMKNFLRVENDVDDILIAVLITAGRELCEAFLNRSLCNKGYLMTLDSFPYYTDTVCSQNAYPPSYYSYPQYSTTLWNYSQMIKLFAPPLVSVTNIKYIATDGTEVTLLPNTDFIVDTVNEPARIFPLQGQQWPPCLYVPNAVKIRYVAGFGATAALVPARVKMALMALVANWYENREAASAVQMTEIPNHVQALLWSNRVMDMQPTRG